MTLKASNTTLSLQPRHVVPPNEAGDLPIGDPILVPSDSVDVVPDLSSPQSEQEILDRVIASAVATREFISPRYDWADYWKPADEVFGPPPDLGGSFNTSLGRWVRHGEAEPEYTPDPIPETTIHPELSVNRPVLDIAIGTSRIKNPG